MAIIVVVGSSIAFAVVPVRAQAPQHEAEIRQGTCDSLGPIAFELTAVGDAEGAAGTPVAVVETVGADDAVPLAVSDTELETSLSKLVAADHAIAVYESEETMGDVIACGGIGGLLSVQMAGMVMPGDELAVGLAEVDDSGHSGIALIRAEGTKATLRLLLIEDSLETR